jgi:hypothetical protein
VSQSVSEVSQSVSEVSQSVSEVSQSVSEVSQSVSEVEGSSVPAVCVQLPLPWCQNWPTSMMAKPPVFNLFTQLPSA